MRLHVGSCLLLVWGIGCAPAPAPDARDPDAIAVTVAGRPIDCGLTTTIAIGESAEVEVAADGELELRFGGEDLTPRLEGAPLAVTVSPAPDTPTELVVTARSAAADVRCDAILVHRAGLEAAIDRLEAESAGGVSVTRSDETGAPANLTLRVGAAGDTPSAQAADFLARHADVFGVPADQLVEAFTDVAPDGWAVVGFDQVVDGLPAFDAGLDLEIDPDGVVTSAHARLFVGVERAPDFASTEEDARAAAVEAGDLASVEAVLFDPMSPRPAWWARGADADVVVDDATLEVVRRVDTGAVGVNVEIHRPSPDPLPGGDRAALSSHAPIARADSQGAPPALPAADARVWEWSAEIANRVEAHAGQRGWRGQTHPAVAISQLAPGGVRFMIDGRGDSSAGWYSYGLIYLGRGSAGEEAVVCHEYGHALHDTLRRHALEERSVKEAVADVFWVFCDPWLTGRRRSGYRRQDFGSPPGGHQSNYDEFRRAGLTAANAAEHFDVHDHTYFLSTPFYRMVERYDMPVERAEQLAYFTLGYRRGSSVERFRAFRDAILQEADSWARNGRNGFTEADVCAVAQAFRDVRLDGEYGAGAGSTCGGAGAGTAAREDRFVCTESYCPLCPIENPNPCDPPPTADEPHCVAPGLAGAGDRRICVGGLALTDAECPEGSFHHCWCEADGSWSCTTPCQDLSEAVVYCPESNRRGGGYARVDCSASPGGARAPAAVWLLALGFALWRRRPRAGC